MKTEQTYIDKSSWPRGPWDTEPDRVVTEHAGMPIILKRHPELGHWCGYVGVPEGHPCYGVSGECADPVPHDVHGGCTYARPCDGDPEGGVCHVKVEGEPDRFWLGFDFAHLGDRSPFRSSNIMREILGDHGGDRYWTVSEVEGEARRYAEVLAAMNK